MLTILKTVVAQIDVLETMTPRQFLSFRDRFEAASGFQSAQFRELEALLGRRDPRALEAYDPDSAEHARIAAAMARPSLFDSFVRYLDNQGYSAGAAALDRDVTQPLEPSDAVQRALLAAYADDGEPAQVCERMIDLDEGVMEWRYRHVQMVRRTIGDKRGTGGSRCGVPRDDAAAAGLPRSVGRAHGVVSAARQRRWPGGGISSRRAGRRAEAGARPADGAAAARAPEPRETQSAGCTGRASTACQVAASVSPLGGRPREVCRPISACCRRRAEHAVDGDVGREGDQVLLQPDDLVALGPLVERRPAGVLAAARRLREAGRARPTSTAPVACQLHHDSPPAPYAAHTWRKRWISAGAGDW